MASANRAEPLWTVTHTMIVALAGLALALCGAAILVLVGLGVYAHRFTMLLIEIGIPGVLMSEAAGLAAALTGGAVLVGALLHARRRR